MIAASICAASAPCKICQAAAPLFGVLDFNKHASEERVERFPLIGMPIYYRRCTACGFIFSEAFDDWSPNDFREQVYNSDYEKIDPDYVETRPRNMAGSVIRHFGQNRADIACLDYGGGNGLFASLLQAENFKSAVSYDEHAANYRQFPIGPFDLVTCFEVFEHVTDPDRLVANLTRLIGDRGLLYFSTLLQPPDIERFGTSWWYIAPRNGHISIYSRRSLDLLLTRHGLTWGSFSSGTHMAWRKLPAFAAHLARKRRINPQSD